MKHSDFAIGTMFQCGGHFWRCTDVGSRVVVAIQISVRDDGDYSWFDGPPYPVDETVFDENDLGGCLPSEFSVKRCAECCKTGQWTRHIIHEAFACSALCEVMLYDQLDGVSSDQVKAWKEAMLTASPEDFARECAQRGVKV